MKTIFIVLILSLVMMWGAESYAEVFYISPKGRDFANGRDESTPWRTFARAFNRMKGGDELILLDGVYSDRAETGVINYDDSASPISAQPPSGVGPDAMVVIRARNPGKAIIDGGSRAALFLGRSFKKSSYILVKDIRFEGGGSLYNTSHVTIKDCGFHSARMSGGAVFFIGTNDHENGNSYNLIEDCWIWGSERIIAGNYRSDNNIWRRIIIRGDGCDSNACSGSGNPNVGFTVYESSSNSIQNVIVVDRILDKGSPYADFATAQHTDGKRLLGPNEWLGCISLNGPDSGYYFEADNANDFTHTLRNVIAWNNGKGNINIAGQASNITVENITTGIAGKGSDGVRIAPEVRGGVVRNVININAGRFGVNSSVQPSYCDVYGSQGGKYNQTKITLGDKGIDPLKDGNPPALKYLVRIEKGSPLSGNGYDGRDYGANVIKRYGADGSRYGDLGYNELTDADLWPWPNEDRIKAEMSISSKRGFCADDITLTRYVWEYLGNPMPAEIYSKHNNAGDDND